MSLEILSCNFDTNAALGLGANHLKVSVNSDEMDLPHPCASRADYEKSTRTKMKLRSKIFQYHINIRRFPNLGEKSQRIIQKNYSNIVKKYKPQITDFNFYNSKYKWTDRNRDIVLKLQNKLGSTFVSDVIFERNQSLRDFQRQTDDLGSFETNSYKCPTISMHSNITIFKQHLEHVIDKKYKRFNVEWAGLRSHYDRWRYLSRLIRGKKIWCNVVAIPSPRVKFESKSGSKQMMSSMGLAMAFGAHTFGYGYRTMVPQNYDQHTAPSWLLNTSNWCYKVTSMPSEQASIRSHNRIYRIAESAIPHIDNNTFYSQFVPREFDDVLP